MHKIVDGIRVELTEEEIKKTLESWKKGEEKHAKIMKRIEDRNSRRKMFMEALSKSTNLPEDLINEFIKG